MKEKPTSWTDAPLFQPSARAIFVKDSFDLLPDHIGEHHITKSLLPMAAFKDVCQLAAGLSDVDDGPGLRCEAHFRDDASKLLRDANVPGRALRRCQLERRLVERGLIPFRVSLEKSFENVALHDAARSPETISSRS